MRFTRPLSSVCDLCGNRSLPRHLFVYRGNHPPPLRLSLSLWNCCRTLFLPPFAFTLPSAIVRSSFPWREQAGNDPVILAPIRKMTWWRNSLTGATSSPRLALQVRSRTFLTQLITSLQGTQGSRSGLISLILFAISLGTDD